MTIEQISYYTGATAFGITVVFWFAFGISLLLRKKAGSRPHTTHDPTSWIGFALQGISFLLVWWIHRTPVFSPLIDDQFALNIGLQIFAVILIAASVWLEISAFRALGRQWSLEARLIEGHKLITSGAYKIVRHPIYAAVLGRLIATGITYSPWPVVLIAIAVYFIGTRIRTASEEKLLREAFGKE